ncbi:outer membrane protein [Oceanibium sediminis]|uniref:outer membrane protein n=1 Tax=Oceanibium sediminis TaxID=2026339 RepID=UPI000DD4C204|nr:outer membrane beta-barrel protein [Oceanibium sediminis]
MRNTLTIAAVAAALSAPAFAGNFEPAPAEPVVMAPVPVAVDPGTDWTGAYGGAQLGYGFGDASGTDFDGVLGGLYGGYNYDFGRFVLGAEVDANLADLQIDGTSDTIDSISRLKLRAGVDAGRALFYASGGGAYATADLGGTSYSDFGWTAGAGVDVLVTDRITAGVEYLYHEFNDFDNTGADISANTIAARVGYRF